MCKSHNQNVPHLTAMVIEYIFKHQTKNNVKIFQAQVELHLHTSRVPSLILSLSYWLFLCMWVP